MIHVFIINSFSGHSERSKNLRERLKKYEDLNYFVFNTLDEGDEKEIAQKMCRYFNGEKIRFYCCGGTGTLRNMLDGISNLNSVEIAYFPCGLNSDYIKCFGDNAKLFYDIDNLINGDVVAVDYIKTNNGLALNTCSVGMDSKVVALMNEYKDLESFGSRIPFLLGLMGSLINARSRKFRVNIGKDTISDEISEIVIGNGTVIAGNLHISNKSEIDDGYCEYGIAMRKRRLSVIRILLAMMNSNFEKIRKLATTGSGSFFEIRSYDELPISMNLDGEIIEGGDFWRIEVIHKGLNLVVPEGIDMNKLYM